MINLSKFAYEKVRLTCTNGKVYEGQAGEFVDIGEKSDLEPQEDGLNVWLGGNPVEFLESEIADIAVIA